MAEQANQALATLRKNAKEFRTLITGVQIFLGRFGYGVGPFTGKLDAGTKQARTAYQKKTGLPGTGDINFETLKHYKIHPRKLRDVIFFLLNDASEISYDEKRKKCGEKPIIRSKMRESFKPPEDIEKWYQDEYCEKCKKACDYCFRL